MENASKALIMAAGILVGILIISLAVYLFADLGGTSAKINKQVEQQKIVQFNSQFTSYIEKELTIYDVVTILGYAQENNKYYEGSNDEQIQVILKNKTITEYSEEQKKQLIESDQNNLANNELKKYKLQEKNIKYNKNEKVTEITFTEQ